MLDLILLLVIVGVVQACSHLTRASALAKLPSVRRWWRAEGDERMSLRHHCIRLNGLEPTTIRRAWVERTDGTRVTIDVTADQCFDTDGFWSLFALTNLVSHWFGRAWTRTGYES